MIISSCPLRISLFGGSTDNPFFVEKFGYGSVISFSCNLKTYVTISQDRIGFNQDKHKYILNYSRREEVSTIEEIRNEVIRVVLEYFSMPPVQVTLTSDAYSQGSGLASSSSYIISLIKACTIFLGIQMTQSEICKLAYELELKFNPYCGYQDPYGCGMGGFKRMEFMSKDNIKYEYLSTDFFDKYDAHLIFTGVTRNSKPILKDVTGNLDKVKPLLDTLELAHQALRVKEYDLFLDFINQGWYQKKDTCESIMENESLRDIEKELSDNESVLAYKLCGAGNGGFFLTFSHKDTLTTDLKAVKINVVPDGVTGESI